MNELKYVNLITTDEVLEFTSKREGEFKIGQSIQAGADIGAISEIKSPYVIFGIPEDIGIRANRGISGAAGTWRDFLSAFCNIQQNLYNVRFARIELSQFVLRLQLTKQRFYLPSTPIQRL